MEGTCGDYKTKPQFAVYVFHHFELSEKVEIIERLVRERLAPGGRLVIADISFPTRQALDAVRVTVGDGWEDELYWIATDALPALEEIGIETSYAQVSTCAGVYQVGI